SLAVTTGLWHHHAVIPAPSGDLCLLREEVTEVPTWRGNDPAQGDARPKDKGPMLAAPGLWLAAELVGRSDLLHGFDAGDEVAEQVLDAALERRGRGGAARAGALHVQEHRALAETA